MLVDRIDTDKDGFVTEQELQAWVGHVGKRYAVTRLLNTISVSKNMLYRNLRSKTDTFVLMYMYIMSLHDLLSAPT